MSAGKHFLDTNILLYLLSADGVKANTAETILAAGGVVSVQVLNEFASVAMRKIGMSLPEVCEFLSTVRKFCTVHPLDLATHDLGLDLLRRHSLSVFDAMIVAAAAQAQCTVLYTEDMQHGSTLRGVRIRNPFAAR